MLTIFDFGATGDGFADDSDAIAGAAATGCVIIPALTPGGDRATYKVTRTIDITGCVVQLDGVIDATEMPPSTSSSDGWVFSATGTRGESENVSGNAGRGFSGVSIANDFSTGDVILIENDEKPVAGMTRSDRWKGEIKRIGMSTPTKFYTSTPRFFSYNGEYSIVKLEMTECRVYGYGKIICGGIGSGHGGVSVQYGMRPIIRGISIIGAENMGIRFEYVLAGLVDSVTVEKSTSPSFSSTGYGVYFGDGTTTSTVTNSYFFDCRHGVAGNGRIPAMFCTVSGCVADDALLDSHENTFYWQFVNNVVTGGNDGILLRGQQADAVLNRLISNGAHAIRSEPGENVEMQIGQRIAMNRFDGAKVAISADGRVNDSGDLSDSRKVAFDINGNIITESGKDGHYSVVVANAIETLLENSFLRSFEGRSLEIVDSRVDVRGRPGGAGEIRSVNSVVRQDSDDD